MRRSGRVVLQLTPVYTAAHPPAGIRYTHVRNAEELLEAGKFGLFESEPGGALRADSGLISSSGSNFF